MAKDLPYFKFFCSEWADGDITLEDYNIQGLFINVCAYYWSNECYLSIDKLKKRFKHNVEDIDYMFKNDLLHNENSYLSIHFLDEQLEERKATSKRNSKAGKLSAQRRKEQKLNEKSTPVEIPLNENPTIKRREEKKREDNIHEFETEDFKKRLWDRFKEFSSRNNLDLKKVEYTARNAYSHYQDLEWKNVKGKEVKNLYQTIVNNWFKDIADFRKANQQIAGDPTTW